MSDQEMNRLAAPAATQASIKFLNHVAPIALVFAVFRPAIFEVQNSMMLLNALETTTLTALMFIAFRRWSGRELRTELTSIPIISFSVAFTLVFGVAVGLGSTNLGTLSRYRVPMLPLLAPLVLVLAAPRRREAPAAAAPQMGARSG